MAETSDKTRDDAPPDYVNALLKEGSSPQHLMDYLNRQMVPVPGFTPPSVQDDGLCQIPPACSVEDSNEFRSARELRQAVAAEAKPWSEKLPPEYRPAIVAILHGGLQIEVRTLAQVSFDGIRIEGMMGDSPCSLLAHQGTVQLVCHAVRVEDEEEHHPIGFVWPDRNEQV